MTALTCCDAVSSSSTTCSSSTMSKSGLTKRLRFRTLEVIEFPMEIGDNPSVKSGCPVRLGDEVLSRNRVDINQFEAMKVERRTKNKLRMDAPERSAILIRAGYTVNQIIESCVLANEIKKQREESYSKQPWDNLSYALATPGRRVKKMFVAAVTA